MFNPATLTATARRIHDLRMASYRPGEIAEAVGCTRKQVKSQCERLRRQGAKFPQLPKGKATELLEPQIERVVALKRKGLSIRAIMAETGLAEGRISYFTTLARKRGIDVPWVPGGGNKEPGAVKLCGTYRGYRRCVVGATEAEARAGWEACLGGTIERVEVIP